MRKPADWMYSTTDDPILETLREDGNQQPVHVAERINRHRKYVGERLRKLARHGLVENMGRGLYRITVDGERYLDGDVDAGDLSPVEDREK